MVRTCWARDSHQGSATSEYLKTIGGVSKGSVGWAMLLRGRAPLWATSPVVLHSVVAAGDPQSVEVLPILPLMEGVARNPQMDPDVLDGLRNVLKERYGQGEVLILFRQVRRRAGLTACPNTNALQCRAFVSASQI